MARKEKSTQHASTSRKHKLIYDRYLELVQEARAKLNGPPQMVYTTYFYQILCEEYDYGIAYISTIINRERRRRDAEERQATEMASQRENKLHEVLDNDAN